MNISSVSITRPVLTIVLSIAIVLFGVIGFIFVGIREYPSVDPPIITVTTGYTGEADSLKSVANDGVALLQKPYGSKDLGRQIRSVLDGKVSQ